MSSRTTFSVNQGSQQIVDRPAILRATVGPGFVVTVCLNGKMAAGMLNLPFDAPIGKTEEFLGGRKQKLLLGKFLKNLREIAGSFRGARAEIVGGADSLKIYPANLRNRLASQRADWIAEQLKEFYVPVKKRITGGVRGRTIVLELRDDGTYQTSVTNAGQNKAQRSLPPESPPTEFSQEKKLIRVDAGKLVVAHSPTQLMSVLGSCVGLAMADMTKGVGGLAHVMMPRDKTEGRADPAKYADRVVPVLLDKLIQAGADPAKIGAKIAGGANILMIGRQTRMAMIGEDNSAIIKAALKEAGIPLLSEDVGGAVGRKMWVNLRNFNIRIKLLNGRV